jgi:hypothetical protein
MFAVIRHNLTSCCMSRLPNSAVRDVATAGLIFWSFCGLKSPRDRFGPKSSQWQRSLKILHYSPISQHTSMQMVNFVATPFGHRCGSVQRAVGRYDFTKARPQMLSRRTQPNTYEALQVTANPLPACPRLSLKSVMGGMLPSVKQCGSNAIAQQTRTPPRKYSSWQQHQQ